MEKQDAFTFMGYRRTDGRAGVRNHVLVIPTCACSSDVAEMITRNLPGAVGIHNQNGCGQVAGDRAMTLKLLAGLAANPNVYGVLLVGLGCEQLQWEIVKEAIRLQTDKPVEAVEIQQCGGVKRTVAEGKRLAGELIAQAAQCSRVPCPISDLIVGTNCGGSDPTSGLSANLVIGYVCDRLADLGATSIISETPEFVGAEKVLAKQAATDEIGQQILDIVARCEQKFIDLGENIRSGNPSQGNKAGGITTLEEKSLGCIHKAGTRPIQAVLQSCDRVNTKGTVVMDTCAYDVCSVAEMTAGGAQLTIFSTGRGTPSGNPVAPVLKLTGNEHTASWMEDFIDFDTSPSLRQEQTIAELGEALLQMILRVASGELVKHEIFGIGEIAMPRLCNYC
ncbi:MAG: UxaA family hydrolase [Peptococcaceae bacterium]|nr:UxaA family hydrolase [Peptococcaceae bacterium]